MVRIKQFTRELLKSDFAYGFGAGLVYFGYTFSWIWALYPLNSVGITNSGLAFLLVAIGFGGSIIVSAIPWGLFTFFLGRFSQLQSVWFWPLTIAGTFTILEYVRAWLLGIVWLGSGSRLGPYWTFGNLAYWFADVSFIARSAAFWGIYGITFIIVLLIMIAVIGIKRRRLSISYGAQVLAIILLLALAFIPLPGQQFTPVDVAIIQTQKATRPFYSSGEVLIDFRQKLDLVSQAAQRMPNGGYILLPEGADFSTSLAKFLDVQQVKNYFQKLSNQEIILIDNVEIASQGEKKISRSLVVSSKRGALGQYDKFVLSPWGEFRPYIANIVLWLSGNKPASENSLQPGPARSPIEFDRQQIEIIVCSDVLSPQRGDVRVLFGMGSLGFFNGNERVQSQISAAARFRALESGKYLVWASNGGRSYIINPLGKATGELLEPGYEILTGSIIPNDTRTWYNRVGDWPILLLSLAFFATGLRKRA